MAYEVCGVAIFISALRGIVVAYQRGASAWRAIARIAQREKPGATASSRAMVARGGAPGGRIIAPPTCYLIGKAWRCHGDQW